MIAVLRELLGPALARAGLETTSDAWRIADLWERLVGPAIAEHATPIALRRGELVVGVPQAVWRQELVLLAPEIKQKINLALGREAVERIRLVGGNAPGAGEPRLERRAPSAAGPPAALEMQAEPPSWPELDATPALRRALGALERARSARLAAERGRDRDDR